MDNKLFLICPFSCIENFIQKQYGENIFFLTSTAAIFNFDETSYAESVKEFIATNNITEVVIVNDLSCRFLRKVLRNEWEQRGASAETILQDILNNNYAFIMQPSSTKEQLLRFATLNIQEQIHRMMGFDIFGVDFMLKGIKLTGIISDKLEQQVYEFKIPNGQFAK